MDPLWGSIADLWWIAPLTIGAGALGVIGLRYQRRLDARRLEYDAARVALHDARARAAGARAGVKLARAELARAQAEQSAARAADGQVAAARSDLHSAQQEARVAGAEVQVRRGHVAAARAAVPPPGDPSALPLARTMAAHDTITARWLEYETDQARRLSFPAMSDGRVPETAAFLLARAEAVRLRPSSARAHITPARFAPYRDAVARLGGSFARAEQEAWRQARAAGTVPPDAHAPSEPATVAPGGQWTALAQQAMNLGAQALTQAADAAAAAMAQRARSARRTTDEK